MAAEPVPVQAAGVKPSARPGRMQLLCKEVFLRHRDNRPPITGFVSYVSKTQPILMHCHGWEDYSDAYDDYSVSLSCDNGKTWSAEEVRWKSTSVPEGRVRYAEPIALFDPETEKLIVLLGRTLYPNDKLNVDSEPTLVVEVYDGKAGTWAKRREIKAPGQRSAETSFGFGIKTSQGRVLFPTQRRALDANGKAIHYRKNSWPMEQVVTARGEYDQDGELTWRLGQPLNIAPEQSSRGICEATLTQLRDGRIAAVCRGSNNGLAQKPGSKWLSFSRDEGETWSAPVPLPATEGEPLESSASGSALFRSIKNGKLYWMGNLALRGEHAEGNFPRSPLVIVEVQEEPFALKRDTIFAVDDRTLNESARLQLSNFRFYQDRQTGDVVIFLTRYSEASETDWKCSDYYRYRVEMP
jgi:hypothetical protein